MLSSFARLKEIHFTGTSRVIKRQQASDHTLVHAAFEKNVTGITTWSREHQAGAVKSEVSEVLLNALAIAANDGNVEVARMLLLIPGGLSPLVLKCSHLKLSDSTFGSLLHAAD